MDSMCDNYFGFRKTVLEMLSDRGYDVRAELTHSITDFRLRFGPQPHVRTLGFLVSHLSDPSNTLRVVFVETSEVKVGEVCEIYKKQIGNKNTLKRVILLVFGRLYASGIKEIEGWPLKYVIMDANELNVTATMNDWRWKKYEVLTHDETVALFSEYISERKQLPPMPRTDLVARYYGVEEGQVMKIIDTRATVGNEHDGISYRIIV